MPFEENKVSRTLYHSIYAWLCVIDEVGSRWTARYDIINWAQDWNLIVGYQGDPNHLKNFCDASMV